MSYLVKILNILSFFYIFKLHHMHLYLRYSIQTRCWVNNLSCIPCASPLPLVLGFDTGFDPFFINKQAVSNLSHILKV